MHSSQPLQTPAKNGRLCNGKFSNQNNLSDFDPCLPQGLGASNYLSGVKNPPLTRVFPRSLQYLERLLKQQNLDCLDFSQLHVLSACTE